MKKFAFNAQTGHVSIAHPHLKIGWNNYVYVGLAPMHVETHRIYATTCIEDSRALSNIYQDHEFGSGKVLRIPRRKNANV